MRRVSRGESRSTVNIHHGRFMSSFVIGKNAECDRWPPQGNAELESKKKIIVLCRRIGFVETAASNMRSDFL